LFSRQDAQEAAAVKRRLGLFFGSLQVDTAAAGAWQTTSLNFVLPSAGRAIMATITTSTIGEHPPSILSSVSGIFPCCRGFRKRAPISDAFMIAAFQKTFHARRLPSHRREA